MNMAIASSVFGRRPAIGFASRIVDGHLHGAAAVAVEVAALEHEIAAPAHDGWSRKTSWTRFGPCPSVSTISAGIDVSRELMALARRRVAVSPQRRETLLLARGGRDLFAGLCLSDLHTLGLGLRGAVGRIVSAA